MCDAEAQPLSHLPERPVRAPPSGTLQKFPRRLGQFPLSFLAEPRRVPAPPVMSALSLGTAPQKAEWHHCSLVLHSLLADVPGLAADEGEQVSSAMYNAKNDDFVTLQKIYDAVASENHFS